MNTQAAKLNRYQEEARRFARAQHWYESQLPHFPEDEPEEEAPERDWVEEYEKKERGR